MLGDELLIMAPTGCAAHGVNGYTIHSQLKLEFKKKSTEGLTS